MDAARAKRIAKELLHKKINGWKVQGLLGNGKSAVILRVVKSRKSAALKIFDPDLVEQCGENVQAKRIHREKELIGKSHPHLIKIFDGGLCPVTNYFFIVMELVRGQTLTSARDTIPRNQISALISQVASAARFLLDELKTAHRDIKPDNIFVKSNFKHTVLMDLGVIRPVGLGDATDSGNDKPFLGTPRYSPPEYLLREEADTPEGWRAVTFYQLGGVLHDLIMKRPLFADIRTPPAKLSNAVQNVIPEVSATDVPRYLVNLAQNCLVKDPTIRLKLVKWKDFETRPDETKTLSNLRKQIQIRQIAVQASNRTSSAAQNSTLGTIPHAVIGDICQDIQDRLRIECIASKLFPPIAMESLIHDDTSTNRIVITFRACEDPFLPEHLMMVISVEMIELQGKVIEIRYIAASAPNEGLFDTIMQNQSELLFRGVYEKETVHLKLLELAFGVLSKVVQTAAHDEAGPSPKKSSLERITLDKPPLKRGSK